MITFKKVQHLSCPYSLVDYNYTERESDIF